MDATPTGDLGGAALIYFLLALLIGLVGWIFKSERDRTNQLIARLFVRTDNHAQRLTALDHKTEDE